jgi:ArsR family transcriptional regulator, zinc-responsive transcriptional repressor
MATTYGKSSKDRLAKNSSAQPRSASNQRLATKFGPREERARRASDLLKHVSDPTRVVIILTLTNGEQQVRSLCARLSQSQAAVSHHLTLLRHACIITPRREGSTNVYELTDAGRTLAEVVQRLLDEGTTERSSERPKTIRVRSASMNSPHVAPAKLNDQSKAPNSPSNVLDDDQEERWIHMNLRRAKLIFKKNRGNLSDLEGSELERLQAISRSRMQREFPGPTLIDEKLKRIEERLRGDGAKKA